MTHHRNDTEGFACALLCLLTKHLLQITLNIRLVFLGQRISENNRQLYLPNVDLARKTCYNENAGLGDNNFPESERQRVNLLRLATNQ